MSRKGWMLVLGFCGLLALIWIGRSHFTPAPREIAGRTPVYFRFQADYSHKGEAIRFDYVVACRISVPLDRAGEIMSEGNYAPKFFIKATSDDGALMVRTPRACRENHTTESGGVPDDLFPFVVWFDDVEDLSFGLGYATEDAYESPQAKVAVHGARISAATQEDWKRWRTEAEENYQPQGMIPGPWGYSYWNGYVRGNKDPYDPSKLQIASWCDGYIRLKLPADVSAKVRAEWPEARPRFWMLSAENNSQLIHMLSTKSEEGSDSYGPVLYGDGYEFKRFLNAGNRQIGLPTRAGGGTIQSPGYYRPADTFPLLPRSQSIPEVSPNTPPESYPRQIVVSDDMKGFVACGGDAPIDQIPPPFDPDYSRKMHPLFVNDEQLVDTYNPHMTPHIFFENDQYVFVGAPWGRGAP